MFCRRSRSSIERRAHSLDTLQVFLHRYAAGDEQAAWVLMCVCVCETDLYGAAARRLLEDDGRAPDRGKRGRSSHLPVETIVAFLQ